MLQRQPSPQQKSKSKLLYDWRFTANQFVLELGPLAHDKRIFFQLNSCGNSPYVASSLTRRWVCLLWIRLTFRQVYVQHIRVYTQHVTENFSFCTTQKSSISTGFTEQIMPNLHILCYNGSLVFWTVVSLTTAKFKPLLFSTSGFTLSYTANMFILMILYDFCLSPAQFCYIIVYIRKVESCVQVADRCAPWKISNWPGVLVI
jgi:hypothetical protein